MTVLLWGFYDQGNLGDDLMGVMVADLVKSLGARPVILSRTSRFRELGYESVETIGDVNPAAIILSGGAFIRSGTSSPIEARVEELASFVATNRVPIIGVSLGSDGISNLSEASPGRRAVLTSPNFISVALRLEKDLSFGLPGAIYLPDIVFAARYFRASRHAAKHGTVAEGSFFINLSRRTASNLLLAVRLGRGMRKAFFLAHSGADRYGGEIAIPFVPRFDTADMDAAIDALGDCAAIMSSKLHPGIIALAMGSEFIAVSPRPKTQRFIEEYVKQGIVAQDVLPGEAVRLRIRVNLDWQRALWEDYRRFLSDQLTKVSVL